MQKTYKPLKIILPYIQEMTETVNIYQKKEEEEDSP